MRVTAVELRKDVVFLGGQGFASLRFAETRFLGNRLRETAVSYVQGGLSVAGAKGGSRSGKTTVSSPTAQADDHFGPFCQTWLSRVQVKRLVLMITDSNPFLKRQPVSRNGNWKRHEVIRRLVERRTPRDLMICRGRRNRGFSLTGNSLGWRFGAICESFTRPLIEITVCVLGSKHQERCWSCEQKAQGSLKRADRDGSAAMRQANSSTRLEHESGRTSPFARVLQAQVPAGNEVEDAFMSRRHRTREMLVVQTLRTEAKAEVSKVHGTASQILALSI